MITIEVEGLKEALEEKVGKLLDYSLFYTEAQAKKNAPKDTGYMAQQIYSRREGNSYGEVISPASYSGFIEYGTAGIRVGTPEDPRTEWPALLKRGGAGSGQMMPFMRSSIYSFIAHAESLSGAEWDSILK